MKTFEITKEQIKELCTISSNFTEYWVKENFPQAFQPDLEVGKWYKTEDDCLFFLEKIEDKFFVGYGFTASRNYYDEFREYKTKKLELATDKEVKTALINEAKIRYKVGDKIKAVSAGTKAIIESSGSYDFYKNINEIYFCGALIFSDGKWATICKQPIVELTLEQIAEKFNVSVEQIKIKK